MILGVAAGAPLLSITRTTTDMQDEPIEFSHDLFRGDRTRIVVRTPGKGTVTRASRGRGDVIELRAQAVPGRRKEAGHDGGARPYSGRGRGEVRGAPEG